MFRLGEHRRRLGCFTRVSVLQQLLLRERLFPAAFESARDKPVFRVNRVVLAKCAIGFELCSLQALSPVGVQFVSAGLHVGCDLQTDLERGRLERTQGLFDDESVEVLAA